MKEKLEDKYFLNRGNVLDVLSLILKKIKKKEPLSVIRLGDGEGRMLGYPEFVTKKDECGEGLDFSLNIWFGHGDFSEASLIDLSLQLRQAVSGADIIGLPRKKQFHAHGAYRLVLEAMERFKLGNPQQVYTDAAIHRYLQFGLFYSYLLNNLDFVGLITGRKHLAAIIQDTFTIKHVEPHLIPEEAFYSNVQVEEHFPSRFDALKHEIHVPYKGAVYLVGAGALGKIYCNWIKKAGGIAIDIGSICDSWSKEGRVTHEYHNIEHYNQLPPMLLADKIARFNYIIDDFEMDTSILTDAHLEEFIAKHGIKK